MVWQNLLDLLGTAATAALVVGLGLGTYIFFDTPLLRRLFLWLLGVWLLNAGLDIFSDFQTVVSATLYTSMQRTLTRCAHTAVVWVFLWHLVHVPRAGTPAAPVRETP